MDKIKYIHGVKQANNVTIAFIHIDFIHYESSADWLERNKVRSSYLEVKVCEAVAGYTLKMC